MQALDMEIFAHDSDTEVAHKINTLELTNWINHLTYIRKELKSIIGFYKEQSIEKRMEHELICQRFEMRQVNNEVIIDQLQRFESTRSSIIECEDTHCDMSFIQEHEKCRRIYLYHIDKYRKLKDSFFKELQSKILSV